MPNYELRVSNSCSTWFWPPFVFFWTCSDTTVQSFSFYMEWRPHLLKKDKYFFFSCKASHFMKSGFRYKMSLKDFRNLEIEQYIGIAHK